MKRLARIVTGAVLAVALVGSVAAFSACGSKDIAYQFQGYCYDHSCWGILTLYANNTMDGYMFGAYSSDNTYAGTWEIEENRFYTGLTVTYTTVKNTGTGEVSNDEVTISAVADENGDFAFGTFNLPMYVDNYAVMSGCSNTYSESISEDNYWTDYSEWKASVEGTTPVKPASSLVSVTGTATGETDETEYSISFLNDLTVNLTAGDNEYAGTWGFAAGKLAITMEDSSISCVVSEETTTDEEGKESSTGNYIVTYKSGDTEKATFTIKASKIKKLKNAAVTTVATFTGSTTDSVNVTATLSSDGTFVIENDSSNLSQMSSDGTWAYTESNGEGSLTFSLNGSMSTITDVKVSSSSVSFTYTISMSGYTVLTCTLTCTDKAQIAAIMGEDITVVATFTGQNGENTITLTMYSDGNAICDNGLGYNSDLTWSYSDGTLTVKLNGTTSLTTTFTGTSATIAYENSNFGISTAINLTCDDVTGIIS
ncbi:MAG: hypothetical protein LUD51_04130 [Clostridia bacterium]|nr:hypothetical protein [Clostridia bacterium]